MINQQTVEQLLGDILCATERDEAKEFIRSSVLAEHADVLVRYLAPSARLIVSDDAANDSDHLVISHFGGFPDLPDEVVWPVWDKREYLKTELATIEKRFEAYASKAVEQPERIPGLRERRLKGFRDSIAKISAELRIGDIPLAFLGQLSMREINSAAPLPGWPSSGILAFFYDASWLWGFSPLHRGHCRVLYFSEDLPLTATEYPEHLPAEARFPERSLSVQREWILPGYLELDSGSLAFRKMDEYRELLEKMTSSRPDQGKAVHRCGGFPQEIQSDMRLECQLVTHGLYCGNQSGYKDPRAAELAQGAPDWQLLAQFDSDEARLGWMWGDAGRVYFWARRQDIEAADFSGAWAILQCY